MPQLTFITVKKIELYKRDLDTHPDSNREKN
jgi:hypothetical protein